MCVKNNNRSIPVHLRCEYFYVRKQHENSIMNVCRVCWRRSNGNIPRCSRDSSKADSTCTIKLCMLAPCKM